MEEAKNFKGKNEEQYKAIENQKKVQTKLIGNKIKPTLLKIIYNQKVKDKNINNDEAKK